MKDTIETDFKGYISIHRKIEDNWMWLSEPFTKAQAWIDLLLLANHKDNSFFLRGIKIDVKRGQIAWSEDSLASRWKWSRGKVRNFLKLLKIEQQIEQHKSNKINVLEILNYDSYQKVDNRMDNKKTTDCTTKSQQKDTNNNVNNVNNDNNIIYHELAKDLKIVLENKLNKKISKISSWSIEIKKLVLDDLKDRKDPVGDVKHAINAIEKYHGTEYFAIVESAKSLRQKFSKIESFLERRKNTKTFSSEDEEREKLRKYYESIEQ